jgi:predicted nucleic acid-binding protein
MNTKTIRSVSFDTSFLLRPSKDVDRILKVLKRDGVSCFITSTVVSELDRLKVYGRIEEKEYARAMSRWKRVNAKVIDFKNRLLSSAFRKECEVSMGKHHGVKPEDIANDCSILVTSLKSGIDVFLSEDFHFTSKVTSDVLDDVKNKACSEYSQMCDEELFSVNAATFEKAYSKGTIDLDLIESSRINIRKAGKRI